MTTYYLRVKSKSPAHNVVFKAGKTFDRIEEFFVTGNDPTGTPFGPPLIGEVQSGVTPAALPKLDYLPSFGGVPIFSSRVVAELGDTLKNEVEFHSCRVLCDGEPNEMYVARLLRRMHLLDYSSSGLGGGTARFQSNFIRPDLDENFLLAREQHELKCYVFVGSERFKAEVEKRKLGIAFDPAAVRA